MAEYTDKETESKEYVCRLSEKLVKQAEEELNEKPEWRSRDVQALRDMILKRKDLNVRTDDAYLLRFLRAKKFDYDRAFNLLVRHFKMKSDPKNSKLFSNLRPSAVKHVLDAGVAGVLPHRDKLGRKVIVFRPGRWEPSQYSLDDVFKTNFLTLSKLIEDEETQISGVIMIIDMAGLGFSQAKNMSPFYAKKISSLLQDEETQITGIIMVNDLKGVGFKHARNLSPFYMKRVMGLLQDCFPMRFKGIHYLNEPTIFDMIFAVVKQFMKEKILNRIHFHGTKVQELTEYIDAEHLPSDYGGTGPPYSNEDWKNILLSCESHFVEEAKYSMAQSTSSNDTSLKEDALDCMAGSYRNKEV